jgi:AcrR family transcriptional regulator
MNALVGAGMDQDHSRERILEVAETRFRRVGHQKTSVDDIASELGMSRANIYRFFSSRIEINECVCERVLNEVAEIASAIARMNAPAIEKVEQLLTAIHRHNKRTLVNAKPTHDLIAAAVHGNWRIMRSHIEQIVALLEAIIREGSESGEFDVQDATNAAWAIRIACTSYLHPTLIEQLVQQDEDTEAGLRDHIRFILKALRTSR